MTGGVIVDTGTTLTRFPTDIYIIFRTIFRSEVRDIPMFEYPAEPFDTCYANPDNIELHFPVVKLYFGSVDSSHELVLAQERVVLKIHGLYCLAFIGWKPAFSILGINQLQGVGLTFDTSANTLDFDVDACD
ncbi:hypothetical protein CQW23_16181 [Capsicum baccatum]|uniref:Peptidase A1 domain-containing protein n=1 Tax=Capsicum baccatum TaxID=33114 RepID=A0A2G2WA93_CAPBA|nr:hypothetical protein CQW23_16181 [Capsicum baccatum]